MKRLNLILLSVIIIAFSVSADNDEKFFLKAQEIVWGENDPDFNAMIVIPDSLYGNESAVIIAMHQKIDVKRVQQLNVGKYTTSGKAFTNAIEMKSISRMMIKLNDANAVEEYSDFDFSTDRETKVEGYPYQYVSSAFGARVFKPNGMVINVDCSNTYSITEGKKNKVVERRIPIPGLEPGDVIEYFYYDEVWLDEFDLEPFIFLFARKYPMMLYKIECHIDPEITVEYRNFNGAPILLGSIKKDGTRVLGIEAIEIPKRETGEWMSSARQLPYIKMYVMNNQKGSLVYRPKSSRIGISCGLDASHYYRDISHVLTDMNLSTGIVSRATKIVKKLIENHPEFTTRQIIDAAWLATVYEGLVDEKSYSTIALSLYFPEVLKKLKITEEVGVGVVNSRKSVPISQILHWQEPTYMNFVGDSCYMLSTDFCFLPGEFSGYYAGEEAAVFMCNGDKFTSQDPQIRTMPTTRIVQNTMRTDINVSLDSTDMNMLNINRSVKFNGAMKEVGSYVLDTYGWITSVEDYLEIPINDREKSHVDSVEIKKQFDELFMLEAELILGVKPSKIHDYAITSRGVTPDAPSVSYTMTCDVDGLVARADKDLIISLGKLLGNNTTIEESERNRNAHIYRRCPNQYQYVITFDIPKGYTINQASLDLATQNVTNECGAFITQAKIDGNKLTLVAFERYLRYVESAERWSQFLQLVDAVAAFGNSAIILTPTTE